MKPLSENTPKKANWYAIYTKSRFEKKIYASLLRSNFQAFLPLTKEKRVWSDRVKTVDMPLLPSYVFVRLTKCQMPLIYTFPGFVRFICFEGKPCTVSEKDISLLRELVKSGFEARITNTCQVGDQVRVIRGPLRGWEGTMDEYNGNSRAVFYFEGISQCISVVVDMADLELIGSNKKNTAKLSVSTKY